MHDFELNGHSYRSNKLNVIRQFHVARKLAPLVAKAGPDFTGAPTDMGELLHRLSNIMEAVSNMPEDDCNFILHECLSQVRRIVGNNALPVWNAGARMLMFDDIELPEMLMIVKEVINDNLANFIPGAQSTSNGPVPDLPSPS